MYKAILVDDEYWTLEGYKKRFNWDQMGYTIIAECTDSTKALEIIIEQKPDVAFVDVRMPELSGLELMKAVRKQGIDTEFVVVSGFSEFAYVQEALRNGALDYCLKPLKIETATEVLENVTAHLAKKREIKDMYIFDMLFEKENVRTIMDEMGIEGNGDYYQVILVKSENYEQPYLNQDKNYIELKFGGQYIYLVNGKSTLANDFVSIKECVIGISQIGSYETGFAQLYREADMAAYNSFIYGKGKYLYKKEERLLVQKFFEQITVLIESKNIEQLKAFPAIMNSFFVENKLGLADLVFWWNLIIHYLFEHYNYSAEVNSFDFKEYTGVIEAYENLVAMAEDLSLLFISLVVNVDDVTYCSSENFENLLAYIHDNYDQKLYLKDLSQQFCINMNYCNELFKKTTSMTFTGYVTCLRMKKAKELLTETNQSISEICSQIGFNDYYHFNKIFKKYYNITPFKFRKNNGSLIL